MYNRSIIPSDKPFRNYPDGISVVICCHNSKARLTETLTALARQVVTAAVPWEIVVVDNASNDGTGAFAQQVWQVLDAPVSLLLTKESQPGQSFARQKGIACARFGIILFCDDDNWLCPEYVETIYRKLTADPRIAACGGQGIPHFEALKPDWFDLFQEAFATGPQLADRHSGVIISLYGAGLGINRRIFDLIADSGYINIQSGRTGESLCSSEDIEMTNAFVLLGYRLVYLDQIRFVHFLPAGRTNRDYLVKLFRSFGEDGPIRNLLYESITHRRAFKWLKYWSAHIVLALVRLVKYAIAPPKPGERQLYLTWSKAYLAKLWTLRTNYRQLRGNIARLKTNKPEITAFQTSVKGLLTSSQP